MNTKTFAVFAFAFALLLLLSLLPAFAQSQTTIQTSGGTIVENSDKTLMVTLSPVVFDNGIAADGYVSLSTGPLESGNPKQPGFAVTSYGEGGSFVVSVVGQGTIFNGVIDNATWQGQGDRDLAFYTLTGDIESLDYLQTGSFTLTTQGAPFTGSDSLSNPYSITVTLD